MAKQPQNLVGRVAAITGGARGIGKETARAFVAEGMRVAIGDLDLELAEATAAELGAEAVAAFPLDVTDRGSVDAFVAGVRERFGSLDVYVNNAGIMALGQFLDEDDATAHRQTDINVHGVLYGMKAVLPMFRDRGRGHLVNVASTAGKGGFPGGATYCGTKHFVVGVSEAVRSELKGTGVEVSCVMPVIVKTELAEGLQQTRGVKHVEASDVAAEIVSALKVPRFDVFVPRSVGPITQVMSALPRGGRELLARALKADRALAEADPQKRAAYELRASRSDPALQPAPEQAALAVGSTPTTAAPAGRDAEA